MWESSWTFWWLSSPTYHIEIRPLRGCWLDRITWWIWTAMYSMSLRYYYHLDLYYSFAKQGQSIIYLSFEREMTNSYFKVKCFLKSRVWSMYLKTPNELFSYSSNQHIWTKEMISFHSHFTLLDISMHCVSPYLGTLLEFQYWINKLVR
jgi:hypothetical protein